MPEGNNKVLKHNYGEKSMKVPFDKNTPSGYSLFTNCLFNATKNKLVWYRVKDCMKYFCTDLRKHTTKIINYEKERNDTMNK